MLRGSSALVLIPVLSLKDDVTPERYLSSFIARLLSETDPSFIAAAIIQIESLIPKFDRIVRDFSREGVVYQLTDLLDNLPHSSKGTSKSESLWVLSV